MLSYVIEKVFFVKSIVVYAMFFFLPLCAMDQEPLVNCGLIPLSIPREVVALIKFDLTLQDLGHLKLVSKTANKYWDIENICPCLQNKCNTAACKRLAECHYDIRTKVLAHYAQTRNAAMFEHVWECDAEVRESDLARFLSSSYSKRFTLTIENLMYKYRKHYCSAKKIHKRHFEQLMEGLYRGNDVAIALLKKILPGTGFNIFESSYRKKRNRGLTKNSSYSPSCMLRYASMLGDVDLLLAIIGGSVTPEMFKHIFAYIDVSMIKQLHSRGAISRHVLDKHGNSAAYYFAQKRKPISYSGEAFPFR